MTIHIGRPPRLPLLARIGRIIDRAGGYLAAVLVVGCVTWLAPGKTAPLILAFLLASVVCGPRRPKRAAARAGMAPEFARMRPPLRRMWRLRRPMPGVTTLPPVGG